MAAEPLGVLLLSGGHERAHYAFVLAAGAAAIGRTVTVFATNAGCRALLTELTEFATAEAAVQARGVAGLGELREAAVELGVALLACDSGLRLAGIAAGALHPAVVVAGVPTFLSAVAGGQIVSL